MCTDAPRGYFSRSSETSVGGSSDTSVTVSRLPPPPLLYSMSAPSAELRSKTCMNGQSLPEARPGLPEACSIRPGASLMSGCPALGASTSQVSACGAGGKYTPLLPDRSSPDMAAAVSALQYSP